MERKNYQTTNVYEAGKERCRKILRLYDDFIIGFSGGKDSLTTILLMKEVFDELGLDRKIKVYFYDEEIVPPETLAKVNEVFSQKWVEPYYFTLQMDSEIILPSGEIKTLIFWGNERERWLRPKPDNSISDDKIYDLYDAEIALQKFVFKDKGMNICKILGLRTDESMSRLMGILSNKSKGKDCFMKGSNVKNIDLATPIYDWI